MNTRLAATALALASLVPSFAHPGVLYKSVDANGVTVFSDAPLPGARVIEQKITTAVSSLTGEPQSGMPVTTPAVNAEQMLLLDPEVVHANGNVDLAERELAAARRALCPLFEGVRLKPTRLSLDDDVRLETYRRNLKIARQQLVEVLRDRVRVAPAQMAAAQPRVLAAQAQVVALR